MVGDGIELKLNNQSLNLISYSVVIIDCYFFPISQLPNLAGLEIAELKEED